MDEQEINDAILLQAIRRRLLDEIQQGGGGSEAAQIINNVYGSAPSGFNGITEGLAAGGEGADDPYEYFVNISREDRFDPNDPDGKRKLGWDKTVHRYRKKKDLVR